MQSFRSELETLDNPVVERDIIELEKKIHLYRSGKIDDEKFRSLRLARGVYGQRQPGVQMIRIKIPHGKLSTQQLIRIADISDEYASSTLHATTRQDIQIHYVSLDRTPELWAKLEQDSITLREACGNTVRNITASPIAGIDPKEPFDVSPYAQAMFEYFLRNPVCQEMGRKVKISFSSNEEDSAYSFIHDLGFIPKIKVINDKPKRGFKVLIGGGLGAQPHLAEIAYEFLPEELIIPFTEAVLRVFDRYGERARRHKARLKFLLQEIGLPALMDLVQVEWKALKTKEVYPLESSSPFSGVKAGYVAQPLPLPENHHYPVVKIENPEKYAKWLKTNVFQQKQAGFFGVFVKLTLGNLKSDTARALAEIVKNHAADELRVTINQGYLIKFVRPEALHSLFFELDKIGLAQPGFDSTADITACPGTETCNLGISSSYGIAKELERVIEEEYPELIYNQDIKIKISGCPNSCGQHGIATIGFHGSSLKNGSLVLPALQVLLGGKVEKDGKGRVADKVIKVPSKRGPQVLRVLLADYEANGFEGEYFADYYTRLGENYFYQLLKPLADLKTLEADDYLDWDNENNHSFEVLKAVGECAGVIIDLVATLIYETEEKFSWAEEAYQNGAFADAIYHAYNTLIGGAKALLLTEDIKTTTQIGVLREFDKIFTPRNIFSYGESFENHVLQINQHEPSQEFALQYLGFAIRFLNEIKNFREGQLIESPLTPEGGTLYALSASA
ncbi:MAG: nitrite reductase [Microscillaceae bacterium]|jgi:sulfite reductase (ferredoxin)|nr:nitrite reductase [Microscillaceae bacterium]